MQYKNQQQKRYFTQEQVHRNIVKSFILIGILVFIILILSSGIGYLMYEDFFTGILIGMVVCAIVIPLQLLAAKFSILSMTRSRKADPSNSEEAQLLSLVEGLSLSARLKRTPDVYIVPSDIPNAFASGFSEKDAFIGITKGLMNTLNRQELEGVIAHELSHIVHRDVLLSSIAVSLVSIIMILSLVLSRLAFFSRSRHHHSARDRNNQQGDNIALVMLIISLMAILIRPLAMLVANLIQLSISRKREYAADAYAVRLCSYAEGLASALEKIGGIKSYSSEQQASLGGQSMQCLYINFPTAKASSLFSTHPPIQERINILRNIY